MLDSVNRGVPLMDFVKAWNQKDAVYAIHSSWEEVSETTLKNGWNKLIPYTVASESEPDFEGFGDNDELSAEERETLANLRDYIESAPIRGFGETELQDVLNCDVDEPVTSTLTDSDIMDIALNRVDSVDDEYDDDSQEKVHIDDLVKMCDNLMIGLEQRDFINELQIMSVYSIKERLLRQKPLLMKQMTIDEVFKRQNLAKENDENNNDSWICSKCSGINNTPCKHMQINYSFGHFS